MSLLYNNLTAKFEFVRAQFRSTAYGHAGIGGSIAFCDPSVGLSVAITVFYACMFISFPVYAKLYAGQWPHADRAILFCAGEVAFSLYVFAPYMMIICVCLADVLKLAMKVPELQDLIAHQETFCG